ncbi:MAG: symporter [Nitrospinae bacterium CG11_big_fil_rev_8_21_14_0_20_45_15]|nr:MAG: symporter [Nitrospinae bacterium CG11_big_fil_rev_8_21_14_0_20_45_15]
MTEFSGTTAFVFFIYVLIMLAIGWRSSRGTQTSEGFFLADRSFKAWVTAIGSTASSESAWAVLGTVGMAYKDGFSVFWFLPGCLLGYALNWFCIAERLRKISRESNAITLPDYFQSYFQDSTHTLRILSAVIIFSCMMAYIAAQLTAIGKTFDAVFGVPHILSIPVGGAIVIGYTMTGGFRAVAWTDFVQGLIMACGLVLLSLVALNALGGFSSMVQKVNVVDPVALTWMGGKSVSAFFGMVIGLLGIGLGYPGQPHVLNRYMAAKDSRTIRLGVWIALGWGLTMYSSAILLGICGKVLFPGLEDPEHLFPLAAQSLLPTVLGAIVLTGVLAAIMSTVSAQIIVATSTMAHDVYSKILNREADARSIVFISRATVLVLGVGSCLVALGETHVIFWFVLFAWSGLGASFGPLMLWTLYSKKVTRKGAIAGMLTGFSVTVLWKITGLSESVIYELPPAFFLSALVIWFFNRSEVSVDQA